MRCALVIGYELILNIIGKCLHDSFVAMEYTRLSVPVGESHLEILCSTSVCTIWFYAICDIVVYPPPPPIRTSVQFVTGRDRKRGKSAFYLHPLPRHDTTWRRSPECNNNAREANRLASWRRPPTPHCRRSRLHYPQSTRFVHFCAYLYQLLPLTRYNKSVYRIFVSRSHPFFWVLFSFFAYYARTHCG